MTLGLFIGRLNPPHIGHISIIDKALFENEKVIILIGTKLDRDQNNPLSFLEIKELLLLKYNNNPKLQILELLDDRSDLIWIYNIYKILFEKGLGINDINLYAGDFKNDSAYTIIKKYESHFNNFSFNYIECSREDSFVTHNGQKISISATNLRQALRDKDYELVNMLCDERMIEKIKNYF
ncbi:MAG: adenylyltransferase/cytidyltransferase family protein [Candidatus Gracilibacteria bacterium]|nr:adenylyltransferase/cytidyltransferase family protein [Candidatus Gracilibacteria bacterium]